MYRNPLESLDDALAVLGSLPMLREANLLECPCSFSESYRPRMVAELALESLDGDALTATDFAAAEDFLAGVPAGVCFFFLRLAGGGAKKKKKKKKKKKRLT
jgi:hypothetical protein